MTAPSYKEMRSRITESLINSLEEGTAILNERAGGDQTADSLMIQFRNIRKQQTRRPAQPQHHFLHQHILVRKCLATGDCMNIRGTITGLSRTAMLHTL